MKSCGYVSSLGRTIVTGSLVSPFTKKVPVLPFRFEPRSKYCGSLVVRVFKTSVLSFSVVACHTDPRSPASKHSASTRVGGKVDGC